MCSLRSRLAFVIAFVAISSHARADDAAARHVPLPEPIFTETVTDIDSREAGEIEFEGNGSIFRARRGGVYEIDASVEAEWIALSRLGLRLEPSLASTHDPSRGSSTDFAVSGGAALKLVEDFERDFYLHFETLARLSTRDESFVQPGEPALPLAFDLRAGIRRGPLTLRGGGGVDLAGHAEHLPLRGSIAALLPFESSTRFGFWGAELDVDGARTAPAVVALNVESNALPVGIPLRLGVALPWAIGERDDRPSLGIFVRVFFESARERALRPERERREE